MCRQLGALERLCIRSLPIDRRRIEALRIALAALHVATSIHLTRVRNSVISITSRAASRAGAGNRVASAAACIRGLFTSFDSRRAASSRVPCCFVPPTTTLCDLIGPRLTELPDFERLPFGQHQLALPSATAALRFTSGSFSSSNSLYSFYFARQRHRRFLRLL